jgi:hypothetical protein
MIQIDFVKYIYKNFDQIVECLLLIKNIQLNFHFHIDLFDSFHWI